MSIWGKLFTLGRAGGHEAAAAVVDKNAIRILDQEIRDADTAQGKARDDLAGLVARRRVLENEVSSFRAQSEKYMASGRAAFNKGDADLARQVAQRIADLEADISLKEPQIAEMRAAEEQIHTAVAATDRRIAIVGDGSFSIDQQRYNAQFGGQLYYEIRGGKIVGMLKDVAYQIRTPEFWNSLDMIGGPRSYLLCGAYGDAKGQPTQSNAVSHGCVPSRFRQVSVINTGRKA